MRLGSSIGPREALPSIHLDGVLEMIFAFFAAITAALMSLALFHAARPEKKRIPIRVRDEERRPPR